MSEKNSVPNPDLLELCRAVYRDVREAISSLEGTNAADEFMFVGADGTDTKRIDLAAEDAMLKRFKQSGHSVRIISEECGETIIGDVHNIEFAAIVDPLDGTANAIHDIPFYSVSIAFSKPDFTGIFFGYVCNLANGDEFYAETGKGAYMNGAKIETSKASTVRELTISAYGYRQNTDRTAKLCSRVQKVRVLGSVALELCYVAAGKIDAFADVRRMLRLVDIGAGQLIVKEAGGIVTDGTGNTVFLPDNHIKPVNLVASNGMIHQEILNLITFPEIDCRGDWYYYKGKVKKIAIVSRCDSDAALDMIQKIIDTFKDRVEIYLSSSPAKYLNMEERGIAVGKMKEAGIDFVISLGGDGTILRNMSKMPDPIPILGINMGTLGFLADVDPKDAIAAIDEAISGFMYDERPRLELSINGEFIGNAINEVVATSAYPAKMITYEIYVNRRLLGEIRADGIVFATPTGSTAYAMSAGGPIVTPEVDAILIVPIAPFKLSSRPWIVPFDSEITVRVKMPKKEIVIVTDGKGVTPPEIETESEEDFIHVNENDTVTIKRARYPGRFVKFSDACFYETVRKKLN
ncbi:NAD kinase [Methanimicrococcus sp. At1]|uniref:NAD kinase n=1 Tax=Methanimicrococcus hacksteinii TaxID=3028293 RepID=A0ABU3VMS2_9EURY|nr:bifunctional fructose-bisphosphatase/inositol-phosphate phosphatase [Methanimicrococcus sp. At1]MDV0444704.1 NAD kinase [Methanimicrococcus sp. At1]